MKKIIVSSSILLALTLTLAGCSASDDGTNSTGNSASPGASPTAPAEGVEWTFEAGLKTAVDNSAPVVAGNWEITVGDLKLDKENNIPELFDVAQPAEGLNYAGIDIGLKYIGEGDPTEEVYTIKLVLADETGRKFDTQAPDELYEALQGGMNLDKLGSEGTATGTTFVEVDPATDQFYLAIGVTDDAPPVLVKLNVLDF